MSSPIKLFLKNQYIIDSQILKNYLNGKLED